MSDENDQWIVRNQETNAGDLVADAYRHAMKADIGFENGGGIRNDIMAGDITYGDVIGMLPYDNVLQRIAVSGQQLKAMLERCTASLPELHYDASTYHAESLPIREYGLHYLFLSVYGIATALLFLPYFHQSATFVKKL